MTRINASLSKLPRPDGRDETQINDDLEDEFSFHLEMRARQLESEGMSIQTARGHALSKFGDVQAIKSQCRRLALQERIMLQRINFVMMVVVVLLVAGVGIQVMVTQSRTAEALQGITTQLAQINGANDRRVESTNTLPNAKSQPASGVWHEVGDDGAVLDTGSQLAIVNNGDVRTSISGMNGVLLLKGDTTELGLVFHSRSKPNMDVWQKTVDGQRSHEGGWTLDRNDQLVLDLPAAVSARGRVVFVRTGDVPAAVLGENPGSNGGVVQVQGEVVRTGALQLPAMGELTLRRALTGMGGPKGNVQHVRVTRLQDGQTREVFQTDKFGSDPSIDFMLKGGDTIVVGEGHVGAAGGAGNTMSDAARIDAVTRFLQDILASSDPRRDPLVAREVLDNASKRIDEEFADNPEIAAQLRETVAKARQQLDAAGPGEPRRRADDDLFPKLSPFREVRWKDWTPFVNLDGTWGELVSINDIPVTEIMEHCKKAHSERERKRFSEDLVQVMTEMNKAPGTAVKVQFKDLKTGTVMSIGEAPMTNENRDRVRDLNNTASPDYPDWTGEPPSRGVGPQARRDPPAAMTAALVEEDIAAMETAMRGRFSYLHLRGIELDPLLGSLRKQFQDGGGADEFALAIQRLICRFGDGHGGVDGFKQFVASEYAPMLMFDSDAGVVAAKPDASEFLDPSHPLLVSINGEPIERLIELAGAYVADGSPALKRRRSIGNLQCLGLVVGETGTDFSKEITVELASMDGSSKRRLSLGPPLSKAGYQKRPDRESGVLDDNIGYLRLDQMDEQAANLARWIMPKFKDTRGLVIDVRGNGGGTREALLALLPYLLPEDSPPLVLNVAAYRLSPDFPEDHLAARFLHRRDDPRWDASERTAIDNIAASFQPRWQPPAGEFSDWHYLIASRDRAEAENPELFHYAKPTVVLMDAGCFSATDIFLGSLKGRQNITLMGTPSSGGSGRVQSVRLPNSGLTLELSSMVSFLPHGSMYDLTGIAPDVMQPPIPTDFIASGGTDSQLDAAIELLRGK